MSVPKSVLNDEDFNFGSLRCLVTSARKRKSQNLLEPRTVQMLELFQIIAEKRFGLARTD